MYNGIVRCIDFLQKNKSRIPFEYHKNIYLPRFGRRSPADLEYELYGDVLLERAGELEVERLPDFIRAADLDTDLDLLLDCERRLVPDAERDLDMLLDLE